jgi:hypothetical protein
MEFVKAATNLLLCKQLSNSINEVRGVDQRIEALGVEVESFSWVQRSFNESVNHSMLTGLRTGYETQHWQNVARLMEDCEQTLQNLINIFDVIILKCSVNRTSTISKEIDIKSMHIRMCKQQIAAYRQTMQLCLKLMALYVSRFDLV